MFSKNCLKKKILACFLTYLHTKYEKLNHLNLNVTKNQNLKFLETFPNQGKTPPLARGVIHRSLIVDWDFRVSISCREEVGLATRVRAPPGHDSCCCCCCWMTPLDLVTFCLFLFSTARGFIDVRLLIPTFLLLDLGLSDC